MSLSGPLTCADRQERSHRFPRYADYAEDSAHDLGHDVMAMTGSTEMTCSTEPRRSQHGPVEGLAPGTPEGACSARHEDGVDDVDDAVAGLDVGGDDCHFVAGGVGE